jgi:anti-sigma factor RsiW
MTCAGFEERIALCVGGDLAPEEAAAVEQHLRACADCAGLARGLEEDRAWLASRPPETAEVDYAAMRREIRRGIAPPRRGWKWLAAAAAILLAAGVSTLRRTPARVAMAPNRSLTVTAQNAAPPQNPIPSRDRKGAVPSRSTATQAPEPELTLEDATRMFQALEPESAPPPGSVSPVEIRIATRDPNVTIILLHESKGDSL